MRSAVAVTLLTVLALCCAAAPASARPGGSIRYALQTPYEFPNGPDAPGTAQARASVVARYTLCRRGDETCTWFALSFAARFGCFADLDIEPYPYIAYASGRQTGNGTVHSGEQRFTIGTPLGLEVHWVCLYVVRELPAGEQIPYLVDARQLAIDPAIR